MFKRSLMIILLVLVFSLSWAQFTEEDYAQYTFPVITDALQEVYKEIRDYAQAFDLLPYTPEKGSQLSTDVAGIIIKHYINKKYILKDDPKIRVMVGPSRDPLERLYYLQVAIVFYESDQMYRGYPVLGHLVIIKHIFISMESLLPKITT